MFELKVDHGRQYWEHKSSKEKKDYPWNYDKPNPNSSDVIYREACIKKKYKDLKLSEGLLDEAPQAGLDIETLKKNPTAKAAFEATLKGINFYKVLQAEDGHWPGDYGGPLFLLPGMVITCYITGVELPDFWTKGMIAYLFNRQRPEGGWGIHIESGPTVFGTALNYVALRLLGVEASHPRIVKARKFLHMIGGATGIPSWGKFWLAALGVYDWNGTNSIFPEFWLFPELLPFHPGRWWCHCRMVYLPMAYVYGHKVTMKLTPLTKALREELYIQPYETIDWPAQRDNVSRLDMYYPHSLVLDFLHTFTNFYEKYHIKWIRNKALDFVIEYIHAEDAHTKYVDIGPVNKFINMLSVWHACGPDSKQFKAHVERIKDYVWVAEDGAKIQGYNGSQLWDTAFALQAITESDVWKLHQDVLVEGYKYVELSQVPEDVFGLARYYRHVSKGGWPFSTVDHGWPISDCTAEGLKASMLLNERGISEIAARKGVPTVTEERLCDAVNVILTLQNDDGGWATYENMRGPAWVEYLNPAEVFGGIMVDYSYCECTSASVQALIMFHKKYPKQRTKEILTSIARGIEFIKSLQRVDGSWVGSWAVCFTYAAWFGVEALVEAGEGNYLNNKYLERAVHFLLMKQQEDGGWGESFRACVEKRYVQHTESQVINTSWALLALLKAGYPPESEPIQRAVKLILSRQQKNGDWNQEFISGVFNNNCMITYTAYRNVFPIWALSRYYSLIAAKKSNKGTEKPVKLNLPVVKLKKSSSISFSTIIFIVVLILAVVFKFYK